MEKLKFPMNVPNSLALELTDLLLNKYPLLKPIIKELLDYHFNIFCYIKVQKTDENGYSNIMKVELENCCKRIRKKGYDINYSTIIDNLKSLNYLDVNNSFSFYDERKTDISKMSDSSFPKSYKILKYRDDTYRKHYISFNNKLKLCSKYTTQQEWINKFPEHTNFINSAYDTTIVLSKYKEYLDSNLGKRFKRDLKRIGYKEEKKIKYTKYNILDEEKIDELLFDAFKVNLGIIWFEVSNEGRLYNSYANLSSTHIPFLRYKKVSNLIYLDAKNCQPLALAYRLNNDLFTKCVESGKFYETIRDEFNRLYCKKLHNRVINMDNASQEEIDELKIILDSQRGHIKSKTYSQILFDDKNPVSKKLAIVLNNLFGEDLVKSINKLKEEKIYTITQKIESDVFIEGFKKWNKYIITRHDGIFVEEKNQELAEEIIKKGFLNYGLKVEIDNKNSLEYNNGKDSSFR